MRYIGIKYKKWIDVAVIVTSFFVLSDSFSHVENPMLSCILKTKDSNRENYREMDIPLEEHLKKMNVYKEQERKMEDMKSFMAGTEYSLTVDGIVMKLEFEEDDYNLFNIQLKEDSDIFTESWDLGGGFFDLRDADEKGEVVNMELWAWGNKHVSFHCIYRAYIEEDEDTIDANNLPMEEDKLSSHQLKLIERILKGQLVNLNEYFLPALDFSKKHYKRKRRRRLILPFGISLLSFYANTLNVYWNQANIFEPNALGILLSGTFWGSLGWGGYLYYRNIRQDRQDKQIIKLMERNGEDVLLGLDSEWLDDDLMLFMSKLTEDNENGLLTRVQALERINICNERVNLHIESVFGNVEKNLSELGDDASEKFLRQTIKDIRSYNSGIYGRIKQVVFGR
ncbi:MAG: hypothetical protein OXB84_04260 [Halobacteriovoraceae bacterium]|nr:hypothetical protein [Halobacteriovoraceae bacterium]